MNVVKSEEVGVPVIEGIVEQGGRRGRMTGFPAANYRSNGALV